MHADVDITICALYATLSAHRALLNPISLVIHKDKPQPMSFSRSSFYNFITAARLLVLQFLLSTLFFAIFMKAKT